jgi:hypothetical protein
VQFEATYESGTLNIVNNGNIPLYSLDVKVVTSDGYQTKSIKDFNAASSWPVSGLKQGAAFSGNIGSEITNPTELEIFPVLIGTSTSGKKTFTCGGQYGQTVIV